MHEQPQDVAPQIRCVDHLLLDTHYPRLFNIAEGHSLRLEREQAGERGRTHYQTRWFSEYDAHEQLVARYRTWFNHGMDAPWLSQLGWERYTPTGELEVREVRYDRGEKPASAGSSMLN